MTAAHAHRGPAPGSHPSALRRVSGGLKALQRTLMTSSRAGMGSIGVCAIVHEEA
eukprot:CAMPEP_0184394324 /NCGR_PEP_ID=MMETSP0007-20130409/39693_1 /TAXON_ID=97485 /ORGANISM="Prymnesium parvum, Strain Texoma1" /LENGTH=54 /DNA_ID=CAMNT_0026745847 /DNA_START=59 /DNA_END=219 /DNA_ORIENTATION=-